MMILAAVRAKKSAAARTWYRKLCDAGLTPSVRTMLFIRQVQW
jgi:hypothetical protein